LVGQGNRRGGGFAELADYGMLRGRSMPCAAPSQVADRWTKNHRSGQRSCFAFGHCTHRRRGERVAAIAPEYVSRDGVNQANTLPRHDGAALEAFRIEDGGHSVHRTVSTRQHYMFVTNTEI
jgi:hypothetical protein